MPCYRPLSAFRQYSPDSRSRTIVFGREHLKNYDVGQALDLPCGQCIGCRLERSRRWAVRIMHEAQMHSANSFLTLTYDDKFLPENHSLRVEDFQLFMKRLRRGSNDPLRFFHCGEYGCDDPKNCRTPDCKHTARPHYHVCLFGEDFISDRVHLKKTRQGHDLFTSEKLSDAWGLGHANIGELSFETAAYVARYCLKKATGPDDKRRACGLPTVSEHYRGRSPEYVTMSRRPGIGALWLSSNKGRDTYPADSVVMRGREMLPPPFYDKLLERSDPALFEKIKKIRARSARRLADHPDSRSRRLMDREIVKNETIKKTLNRE